MSQTKVQSGFIGDNAVTAAQIANNAVGSAEIVDGSVGSSEIADGSVGSLEIANGAITTAKLDSTVSGALVPIGGIIMWSGSVATIPSSWRLCNGTNGTPNLRDRFIVGAGSGYAVGATGGSANATLVSHSHTGTTDNHNVDHYHVFPGDDQLTFANGVAGWSSLSNGSFGYDATSTGGGGGKLWRTSGTSNGHTHTFTTSAAGSSATNANLPPYYALAFIMRTS